jgi:hypothetical protein
MPKGTSPVHVRLDLREIVVSSKEPYLPMVVELIVDSMQRKIGKWLVFGWYGSPGKRDAECWPLVIESDGRIDFGNGLDDSDLYRYGNTDLFDKEIVEGQKFRMKLDGEWRDWSIVRTYRFDQSGGWK